MLKLFHYILSTGRKRRCFAVSAALWLLRSVRDAEKDEACRYSDKLDGFDLHSENISRLDYAETEDAYLNCEDSLGFLESAIEDLEFAYEGRF